MAVKLPNGVVIALATAYGTAVPVTAVTNAAPPVVTSAAHGLANGAFGVIASGWARADGRTVRVSGSTTNTFNWEGLDSSNTTNYPAGTGVGSFQPVTAWTQITQVLDLTTNGGDMQFTSFSFLENDFETQLPTQASPMNLAITIGDDASLAGYQALRVAAEANATRSLRMTLPGGSILLFNGVVSFNETPTMTKNQVMAVRATFSLQSRPVRYAS